MRRLHALVILVSLTILASACGVSRDVAAVSITFPDGATSELDESEIDRIVDETTANTDFVTTVFQGEVPPGWSSVVLNQYLLGEVFQAELDRLDVEVSPDDREVSRQEIAGQLVSFNVASADPEGDVARWFDEVPYLPFLVDLQARQSVLVDSLAATSPAEGGVPCARHILVETEAEADEIFNALEGGGDFAALATENSLDPGSGAAGGELGCADPGNYVPEFATAIGEAEVGQVVAPVQTDFGWHIIEVTGFEVNGEALLQERIEAALGEIDVTVSDRFGSWDVQTRSIVPTAVPAG